MGAPLLPRRTDGQAASGVTSNDKYQRTASRRLLCDEER